MQENILRLGATFSRKACKQFDINPTDVLAEVLEKTDIRHFRLMSYWNDIEQTKGTYDFEWLDQDIQQIIDAGGTFSLCLGLRQPRWPECHRPSWAKDLSGIALLDAILTFNEAVVNRYKPVVELEFWQLENEALNHGIGTCRDFSRSRLRTEYKAIKKLDPNRDILMSTSNSWGIPLRRPIPDIVGFSLYH